MIFNLLGIVSLIAGFLVPYVSHESVTIMWQIVLQISFYAISYYYLFVWGSEK